MDRLTKNELTILAKYDTPITLILVPTKHKNENWWMMRVKIEPLGEIREMQTARGNKKLWKSLDSAEKFISEIFPDRTHLFAIQLEPKKKATQR